MANSIAAAYKIRHPKKRAFLEAYSSLGTVTAAANVAEIHRTTHYDWIADDEDYQRAFERARDMAGDYLESEAYRRAVHGTERTFYDKEGNVKHIVTDYSDTLLIFLMKGAMPEKYKDRVQQQHTGDVKVEWVRVNHSPED